MKIPRSYCQLPSRTERELHVFVDASEDAFATVIYLRSLCEETVFINIVAAKARVAPSKLLSIPRLELQAAVLGTRLAKTVMNELRLPVKRTVFWSDSKTVLAWIRSEPRKYKQFVALRIGEILDRTFVNQWKWVNSKDNPADEATKIINYQSIWFEGPKFLYEPEKNWPKEKQPNETTLELKPIHVIRDKSFNTLKSIHVNWCSNWKTLKRSVAIILKYIDYLKMKTGNNKSFDKYIDQDDLEYAETILIQKSQWESYPKEMDTLERGGNVQKDSGIKDLNPERNQMGTMVSKGRIENAVCLPISARKPIILFYKHYISMLILRFYHEKYHHSKTETVIAAIRQRFWITSMRVAIKTVKKNCQYCSNMSAKPLPPIMAPLPDFRTTPYCKPFTFTGTDYFGPYNVSIGRRTEKR